MGPVDASARDSSGAADLNIALEMVLERLRSMPEKLSRTPDGLPPVFFRRLADELAFPLTLVYRRSYDEE